MNTSGRDVIIDGTGEVIGDGVLVVSPFFLYTSLPLISEDTDTRIQ